MSVEATLGDDGRQASAPCSDYINNSRSMSASADIEQNLTLGKNGVEEWYQKGIEIGEASAVRGSVHSDESFDHRDSAFAAVNSDDYNEKHYQDNSVGDIYERQLMEEAKKLQEASQKEYRFNMQDLLNNPALEDAAKQELQKEHVPLTPTVSNAESVISVSESRVSHLEQTVNNSENLDRDADRDLQAGNIEIQGLLDRLNAGKTSCAHLMKFVQKLHQTEVAYSRALLAVSRMNITNIGQTDGFKYVSECICELPMTVRSAHSKVAQTLAECESSLKNIITKIKQQADKLVTETPKLKQVVSSKRNALSRSKSRHQVAFKHMESIAESGESGKLIEDPWLTESQVAHDYAQLISGQVTVKAALTSGYEQVVDLETQRLRTCKDVVASLVQIYGSAIDDCVVPFVSDVEKALLVLDPEEEAQDLKKGKRNCQISERALRMQFAEQETNKTGELFMSPDITRQGSLQVLDEESRSWVNVRCVLTKAGLYWFFEGNNGPRPDDFVVLGRTSIEQAKAPGLKLVQEGSGYFGSKRAVIFRASTVDEYCEWAISLREAIQDIKGLKK